MILSPEREAIALLSAPRSLRLPIAIVVLGVVTAFVLESLAYDRAVRDVEAAILDGQTIQHLADERNHPIAGCESVAKLKGVSGGGGALPSIFVQTVPGGKARQELRPVGLALFDFFGSRTVGFRAFDEVRLAALSRDNTGQHVLAMGPDRTPPVGLVTERPRPSAFGRNVIIGATILGTRATECILILEPWAAVAVGAGYLAIFDNVDRSVRQIQGVNTSAFEQISRSYGERTTRLGAEASGVLTFVVSLLVYNGVAPHLALYRSFGVSLKWRLRLYAAVVSALIIVCTLSLGATSVILQFGGMPWVAWREGLEAALLASIGLFLGLANTMERLRVADALRDR